MAACPTCGRRLPPNANCQYCGQLGPMRKVRARRAPSAAVVFPYLVKAGIVLAIFAGIYWLGFTGQGRSLVRDLFSGLGSKKESRAARLVKEKVPGVKRILDTRPGSLEFEEQDKAGQVVVTVLQRQGGRKIQASFLVDEDEGAIEPLDRTAREWMSPK